MPPEGLTILRQIEAIVYLYQYDGLNKGQILYDQNGYKFKYVHWRRCHAFKTCSR